VDVQNGASGYKYKGINKWLQAHDNENFYYTFKKVEELNGRIKKGSKCRMLFAYIPPKYVKDDESGKDKCVKPPMMRYHQVFRWQDTEGIERPKVVEDKNNSRASNLEEFLSKVASNGIKWVESGNKAEYDKESDTIYIPPISRFESSNLYYATLFREIVKVTGNENHLNRWKEKRHSNEREELIGEIVSATIMLRYGIDVIPETAGDIDKWLKALGQDEQLFTAAMSKAEKCLEYLDK
jgi:antirestriction protein ArdC